MTFNHRDIMSNMLYYLVHLVGRLLRVQGVRDSCVTVFGTYFGAYVATTCVFLPVDKSHGPPVTHNNYLRLLLVLGAKAA